MSEKTKNTISNVMGLILVISLFIMYLINLIDTAKFFALLPVALLLFLFKASQTKFWIKNKLGIKE